MAKILILIFLFSYVLKGTELKTGDVLLQPLSCYSCRLITDQEDSKYSHVALYLKINEQAFVIEAYGKVKLTPLKEFVQRNAKGQKIKVLRAIEKRMNSKLVLEASLKLEGLSYDSQFLLNNFDGKGEKLYCSELIYKIYSQFGYPIKLKKMSFDKNREGWIRFFRGNPPDGELGISPEDFNKSSLFKTIGFLSSEI